MRLEDAAARRWATEFGCADRSVEEFQVLSSYSPVHTARAPAEGQKFPAFFFTTGKKKM
jgi:prolyl oligopeptidase PreP (S9A serine peptidase family)